jgi:undecaprenol kinase
MNDQRVTSSHALSRARISLRGLRAGVRRDRALRELWIGLGLGWLALALLGTEPLWWAVTAVVSAAALAIEHLNTAVETLLDRLHPDEHPEIGAAKDLTSGAAFICNVAAGLVMVGAAIAG